MPLPKTQMQQSAGTGGVGFLGNPGGSPGAPNYMTSALRQTGSQQGGGQGAGVKVETAPTPGVDPAWARMFGTATPSTLLDRRAAGQPLTDPAPQQGQGVTLEPPGGRPTEGSDNGFSQDKQLGGQSNNQRGGPRKNHMTQALSDMQPPGAPPPVDPAAPPAAPLPPVDAAPPVPPVPETPAPPTDAALAPQAMTADAGETVDQGREAAAAPGAPPPDVPTKSAAAGPVTIRSGGKDYQVTEEKPAHWGDHSEAWRQNWIKDHAYVPPAAPAAGQTQVDQTQATQTQQTETATTQPTTEQKSLLGGIFSAESLGFMLGGPAGAYLSSQYFGKDENGNVVKHYNPATVGLGNWDFVQGAAAPTEEGSFNQQGYVSRSGKLVPWEKVTWDSFMQNPGADPGAFILMNPKAALASGPKFWEAVLGFSRENAEIAGTLPDPTAFKASNTPKNYSGLNMPQGLFTPGSPDYAGNTVVGHLVGQAFADAKNLNELTNNIGSANFDWKKYEDLSNRVKGEQIALAAYDVNYDPTPGGQGGTGNPGESGTGSYGGTIDTNPYHLATGDTGDIGNVNNLLTPEIRTALGLGAHATPDQISAAYEIARQQRGTTIGLINQSHALKVALDNLNLTKNSPLKAKSEQIALDMADNPDPTDWGTVRNKAAADSDKVGEQITQNLAKGASRRGLGAGAVAGLQSQALGENSNALASRLGDLSIQQSQAKRTGQIQAMQAMASAYGFTAAESEALQRIMSIEMGVAPAITNPSAGLGATSAGLSAAAAASDQLDQANKDRQTQMWIDAGTAVLGAGGKALAA